MTQPDHEVRRLNGIRSIAVLIVLISHFSNESKIFDGVFGNGAGQFGVMLFFILSSFLMAFLYLDKPAKKIALINFFVARAARVLPVFLLVVALSYAANMFSPAGIARFLYDISDEKILLSHLLLLSGRSVLWTIPPEIHFYILFGVFWLIRQKIGNWVLIFPFAMLFFFIVTGSNLAYSDPNRHDYSFFLGLDFRLPVLTVYPYFCAGLLLGHLYRTWSPPKKYRRKIFSLSVLAIIALYPMIFTQIFGDSHQIWAEPFVFLIVVLVFFLLVFSPQRGRVF
jgi:peptidoglycan/LPS O-acetylase OafA/YrhL